MLEFLGSSEVVVTSAYHGLYWATLLGRKVVVANMFSSKFAAFPFPPALLDDTDAGVDASAIINANGANDVGDALERAIARARAYPHALRECRDANTRFFGRVQELLAQHLREVEEDAAEEATQG